MELDRRQVRRNLAAGYELQLIPGADTTPKQRAGFLAVYEQTMRRTDAAPHYFFGAAYFDRILAAGAALLHAPEAAEWGGYTSIVADPDGHAWEIAHNPGWHLALDLPHMLLVSECIARAALERQESRGGHTRDDFPTADPDWAKLNLICTPAPGGGAQITRQPLPQMPPELAEIFEETA